MEKSKLSEEKQLKLLEHFVAGTTARTVSQLVGVNKTTASFYFHRLRELILEYEESKEMFGGEIEVDVPCLRHAQRRRYSLALRTDVSVRVILVVKEVEEQEEKYLFLGF